MPNFLPIFHLDPFDLAGSLRTKTGLFKEADDGSFACPVRGPKKDDPTRWVQYQSKWVELTSMVQRIKRFGEQMGGIDFGRIDLELLPAGRCLDWRIDRGEAAEFEHAVVMLRTNPAVTLFSGPEAWVPATGLLTVVSRRAPRSAINMGESPAIWLAVDFKRRKPDA